MPGVTAYDLNTAKEILQMWKLQGYDSRVQTKSDGSYVITKGARIAGTKQYLFRTHKEANVLANRMHQAGISSEIVQLENGMYQVIIVTGSGKVRELNIGG